MKWGKRQGGWLVLMSCCVPPFFVMLTVVEDAHLLAVPIQQTEGVAVAKVLKLHQHVRLPRRQRAHHLGHERVKLGARRPPPPQPLVVGVPQQRRVVGPDVDAQRQAARGVDAGGDRVQRDLALADAHPVGAQVAEPQDALAVGYDGDGDVPLAPGPQLLEDAAAVVEREVEAPGGDGQLVVALAGVADGGLRVGGEARRGGFRSSAANVKTRAQQHHLHMRTAPQQPKKRTV